MMQYCPSCGAEVKLLQHKDHALGHIRVFECQSDTEECQLVWRETMDGNGLSIEDITSEWDSQAAETTGRSRELVKLDISDKLLFYPHFIEQLGGVEAAKRKLLEIVDRYFNLEYLEEEDAEDEDEEQLERGDYCYGCRKRGTTNCPGNGGWGSDCWEGEENA